MKKLILYILIISMMGLIFFFSNQPSTNSNKQSGKIINTIIDIVEKVTNQNFSDSKREEISEFISLPIRKCAHFTLYFTLGVLFYNLLTLYNIDKKTVVLASILFCLLYACSDEIHQLFVVGRSCEIRDVAIDTIGSIFGITICLKLSRMKANKNVKKDIQNS